MFSQTPNVEAPTPGPESFSSILYERPASFEVPPGPEQGAALDDLQLNQVIATVVAGREQYDLTPYFLRPLGTTEEISYRHEIMADLGTVAIRDLVDAFARNLQQMRKHLKQAAALGYIHQRQAVFVVAAQAYCSAVEELRNALDATVPASPGFQRFKSYVKAYGGSGAYRALATEVHSVLKALESIRYCFRINGARVTVSRYEEETDYAREVQVTFERFQQDAPETTAEKPRTVIEMDRVEAMVLDRVALLFPEAFGALNDFHTKYADFTDEVLVRFDREIQFYLAYLEHTEALQQAGLHFCVPTVSASKEVRAEETFDLALAQLLVAKHRRVVTNDFRLRSPERIIVVSGPNQGGKTTFARTVGQLHYLASLGLSVPGSRAELFLPKKIFTHFEHGENTADLRGKLMDDLVRIHRILNDATPDSLVILNEIFTSTTLEDAINLGGRILGRLTDLGVLCVCVTFVDELASLNEATVSMVSTVEANDPAKRTFKVVRKTADGLAYAMVLARKYRLTHDQLKERITP